MSKFDDDPLGALCSNVRRLFYRVRVVTTLSTCSNDTRTWGGMDSSINGEEACY